MAAFRAGIRWADMSTESFSRSKTATGNAGAAALLLQAEQADQSYAPNEAVVLPEFENSHAGMNQYFLDAADLGGEDSKNGAADKEATEHGAPTCSSDKSASGKAGVEEGEESSSKMPGFRGLLVATPHDGAPASGGGAEAVPSGRRERSSACAILEAGTLTPAKRHRTSGAQGAAVNAVLQSSEAPVQDGSASGGAAAESASQRPPQSKKRKSTHSRRSQDGQHSEQNNNSVSGSAGSNGPHGKRKTTKGNDRRRLNWTRRASESPANPGLLLQMGAPTFLQLPGLVPPMFMPVGLPPGAAAPLPGLLHPQAVQQQQARVNCSKEQQEKEDEEEWHRRECARMKDIAIGKATTGYRNYVKQVGAERRSDGDPVTPDPKLRCSKAQFQRAYQKWRKQLHQYDTVDSEPAPPAACSSTPSPAEAQCASSATEKAEDEKAGTETSAAVDQDLEAILAFNKECELAGL